MRILHRWLVPAALVLWVSSVDAGSALAQTAGGGADMGSPVAPLTLERAWFSGTKYVHRGSEARSVYGGFGFGLDSEFRDILGQHPEAASAAGKAQTWNVVRAVGMVGFVVVATIDLLDAIDDANKVNEGNLNINGGGTGVLDWVLVAGVALTGHFMAGKYLNDGVRLYNEAEGFSADAAPAEARGRSLTVLPPSLMRVEGGSAVRFSLRLTR